MNILGNQVAILWGAVWIFVAACYVAAAGAFGAAPASSQAVETPQVLPVKVNDKLGFVDRNGRMVIAPQYEWCGPFSEGRAWVKADKRTILIDETGRTMLQSNFDFAGPFHEGLAGVGSEVKWVATPWTTDVDPKGLGVDYRCPRPSGQWGYVDRDGQLVIPAKFSFAGSFHHGVAVVALGEGESDAKPWVGVKWALVDSTGRYLIEPSDLWLGGNLSDGLLLAGVGREANSGLPTKWGYVSKTGTWMIQPQFREAGPFSQGLAAVAVTQAGGDAVLWGYIDSSGKMIIAPQYNSAGEFSEGLASVAISHYPAPSEVAYIDRTGKIVFKLAGIHGLPFSHGFASVLQSSEAPTMLEGGKLPKAMHILIDRHGQQVVPGAHEWIAMVADGVVELGDGGKVEYRTLDGRIIWPPNDAGPTTVSRAGKAASGETGMGR